jgi:putative transposase
MRYPASEKLEIIRLVEQSHLPAKRTLDKLGIPRSTFNRWYDRFLTGGVDALEDRKPQPGRVWNRIPDDIRENIIDLALDEPELSPRELAVTFTDTRGYFVSESSVYRLLKAQDLITSPAFIVIKAADEFHDKTTAPNQLWQTDFTYLKVIGWGWFYLSTILDDYSRYIIAWKLCTTMKAGDVTDTLELALQASGCDNAKVMQRPRLLSDNGPCYVAGELADWLSGIGMEHTRGSPCHPQTQGKIERWHQTLEEPHPARKPLPAGCSRNADRRLCRSLQYTGATTRASAISHRPTSTSDAARPSCRQEKGSNAKLSTGLVRHGNEQSAVHRRKQDRHHCAP